jgi:hypothetical protein
MQRLCHCAEVGADARGHGSGDAERRSRLALVKAEQLGRGRRRAERADRAGGVKAAHVMVGVDRLGNLAGHLEAGVEGDQEVTAVYGAAGFGGDKVGERQGRCKRRDGRVHQQPVRASGAFRQLRVVPVHRVSGGAVPERRETNRQPQAFMAHKARVRGAALSPHKALKRRHSGLLRPGQHHR